MKHNKSYWIGIAATAVVVFFANIYGGTGSIFDFEAGIVRYSLTDTAVLIAFIVFGTPLVKRFLGPIAKRAFSQKENKS